MIIIFWFWIWLFSHLFIDVDSIALLIGGLVVTMITVDIWNFSKWISKKMKGV